MTTKDQACTKPSDASNKCH